MKEKGAFIAIVIFLMVLVGVGIWGIVSQNNSNTETSTPAVSATTQDGQTVTSTLDSTINLGTKNFMHTITLETNYGTIKFETYDSDAPKTVENFIKLANAGFYNSLTFHRVIKDFMIQGGDPNCSSATSTGPCGTGGPGYKFDDELNPNTESYKQGYVRGVVAMANSGPNTNGSQFFIMHQDNTLPHDYTIFGKVVSGMDVVDKIAAVKVGANDRPISPVIMKSVTVSENK
jgi:cyclophilin family peptidyl-prolyl cis-trans isomerase